jgi:hypothetical protein
MKSLFRSCVCLLALSCIAAASSLFTFTYTSSSSNDWAAGTLIANDNGNGTFNVISGSGLYDNYPVALIPNATPPGYAYSPSGYFYYDDQLLPSVNPLLSIGGLMFSISAGSATELNIWGNSPGSYQAMLNNGYSTTGAFSLTQASIPEPMTLPLVLSGFLGLGFAQFLRRRRK